jgi:hypothetical protein
MKRQPTKSAPIKFVRGFEHLESDRVDVLPNAEGEFVQIWSAPRGHVGRYVMLSHQRTSEGPECIHARIRLEGGPWKTVETRGSHRTLYYACDTNDIRNEEILPRGRLLVSDPRQGLRTRHMFTENFDWDKLAPKGRSLGDRAIIKLQDAGSPWYVTSYQESDFDGPILCTVREHLGRVYVRTVDFTYPGKDVGRHPTDNPPNTPIANPA